MSVAIGIDLGTTNCCMAYVDNEKPVIITNDLGDYVTPSYIGFFRDEILFGRSAISKAVQNPDNTIYDVKRFIGRSFDDPCVQNVLNKWKFNLINDGEKPMVKVQINKEDKTYSPEMLSGLLLKHLKTQAEKRTGKKVSKAYITVPTYFNDSQRQSTVDAGKIAGFEEVKLLNEPTAAAIAYSTSNFSEAERTIFVFDFGGGTFDVSLVKVINREIQVIAIDGDINLGGNDVKNNLVEHYAKQIQEEYNFDVCTDKRKLIRLDKTCEDIKIELSNTIEATFQLFGFTDEEIEFVLSRDTFNEINGKIFARTIEIVDRCLKRSGIDISEIDEVVVVGGSTRIKMITTLLEEYFKKPLVFTINADEAVAMGAAIAASKWCGNGTFDDVIFRDISPYSLGTNIENDKMSVLIEKFTELPASCTKQYANATANQSDIDVGIYSGENSQLSLNKLLGKLTVSGYEPGPVGSINIDVTFICDRNGILSVEVEEQSTKAKQNLEIHLDKGGLTQADLQRHINIIESNYQHYENLVEFKEIRQKIAEMCNKKEILAQDGSSLTIDKIKALSYSEAELENLRQTYEMQET